MRTFKNIASLVRKKRTNHPNSYSQTELSLLLGYKNGQFISNVERGKCSIPLKSLRSISRALDINPEELKEAMIKDYSDTISKFILTRDTIVF